jgi:uncharacterized protein YndB with AHSA1/START domain
MKDQHKAKDKNTSEDLTVIHSTFVIQRNYPTPPEKVFAAFADSVKKRRWYAEGHQHEVVDFQMDFRVGGAERSRYRFKESTPLNGMLLTNEGSYQDIVPDRRVVTASNMSVGDKRISASLVTIEFLPAGNGTDLICTHQRAFFEGADGPKMRETGWRTLFERLAKELEEE